MNLFDQLVNEALRNQPSLSALRIVVEKELLHHDILRILSQNGILKDLTFIGGTCLRACYQGIRLSEDLDFSGDVDFDMKSLSRISSLLKANLYQKYGLSVTITDPQKEIGNVRTWKIKIETRPESKNFPAQRIHLDICNIPSYEKNPKLLINPYGVDMGTSGLIIQAQSLEEIFIDKLIALALRENRPKYRDIWDIMWLHQKGIMPRLSLLRGKLNDRKVEPNHFLNQFHMRKTYLKETKAAQSDYKKEMLRFLPVDIITPIVNQDGLWDAVIRTIDGFEDGMRNIIYNG